MAFVITSPCMSEKSGECVDVCPVDCIEEGEDQFYINPNTCIDCGMCVMQCPVAAIVEEFDLTPGDEQFLKKAKQFFENK